MKSGQAYGDIINTVWDTISIYDGVEVFLKEFTKANEVVQNLFAAHWCQSEVRNGGLLQFFCNSSGVLAPEAIIAFRAIGMPKLAAVLEEAVVWFGESYPRDRNDRENILWANESEDEKESNPFETLDDKFFELHQSESGGFITAADQYASARRS